MPQRLFLQRDESCGLHMTGIDWQGAARNGQLKEALYLFACRLAWLRHGDRRAHDELVRASECSYAEIRAIAASLLDSSTSESRNNRMGYGHEPARQ